MEKKLVLIIKTYQDFIRTADQNAVLHNRARLNAFFDAVSDSYIPLLNMLGRLEEQNAPVKLGLVLPPVLCAMLENPKIQELYVEYLEKRIALGKKETTRNKNAPEAQQLAKSISEKYAQLKKDFTEKYNGSLIAAFAEFQRKGFVEILGTCATDIFMPHYAGLEEAISAQVEMGLQSYKKSFGDIPDGFFLPEFGYTPGIEKIIRAYGYSYTILHARSMLLTDELPVNGIFYPVRIETSLVSFTADPELEEQLTGDDGYCQNSVYRNENRDIGYELDLKKLTPVLEENSVRYPTGYKYWKKDFNEEAQVSYDAQDAAQQAEADALDFIEKRNACLEKAAEYSKDVEYVTSVCCIDDNATRKHWSEYLLWVEAVLKNAGKAGLELSFCKDMVENQFNLQKIEPYYSSGAGEGYGENLLSSKNCWMMRYVRKATERMIDLAERFPSDTGLKTRLLNIGSVELLLAQSSSLAKMIEEDDSASFAEERFKLSINAFTSVFDSLGSNTVSTEWLTCLESQDNIFPWINYKIFSKKK
jgi:1,4-alpha-glucan branching enzyme